MFAITRHSIRPFILTFLLLSCTGFGAIAQNETVTQNDFVMRAGSANMVLLSVAGGALIVEGEDEARVTRHVTTNSSSDTPKFQAGDQIIYLNGERIASASQLRTLYQNVAVGDEVKMGVQRGDNKMIKTFIKPEPQQRYESADGNQVVNLSTSNMAVGNMANYENITMWRAGFIVGEEDGRVLIGAPLPITDKAEALSDLKAGDELLAINDTKITTAKQVEKVYGAINVGDDVTVEYKSDDSIEKVMFKKPAAPNMRMRMGPRQRVSQQ